MAAASAGTYQSSSPVTITGMVPSTSSSSANNIILTNSDRITVNSCGGSGDKITSPNISVSGSIQSQLQNQTLLHQQQQLQLQQQQQNQNVIQYQIQQNLQQHQRQQHGTTQFIPRVGNGSTLQHIQLMNNNNSSPNCSSNNLVIRHISGTSTNDISNSLTNSQPPPPSTMICSTSVAGPSVTTINTACGNNGIVLNQIQQQPKQLNSIIQRLTMPVSSIGQQQLATTLTPNNLSANLPPGWRRLISNNEVIYFSPSGESLRSHSQIKEYLLSPGTCKCGLPCPLRPEYFFDFNTQIPNTLLKSSLENGISVRSSSVVCMHQKRLFENQKNLLHTEIKRRKITDISTTTGGQISTSPITQCNSVPIYSDGNIMQTSQVIGNSSSSGVGDSNVNNKLPQQLVNTIGQKQISQVQQINRSNIAFQVQKHHIQQPTPSLDNCLQVKTDNNEKQIGCVTLSKTPPWRKHSILQQQSTGNTNNNNIIGQHQQQQQQQSFIESGNNERVPPLPQAHLTQSNSVVPPSSTPPWQEHSQNRLVKNKTNNPTIINNTKKKPNFKDDPTGYLNQQTAILHNSIMNVVQNSDNDINPTINQGSTISNNISTKTQIVDTIRQQQLQHSGQKTTNNITINDNGTSNNVNMIQQQQYQQTQNIASYQQQQNSSNEIKNDKQEIPIVRKIYTNGQTIFQNNQQQQTRQIMQAPPPLQQNIITNVPSSQQINNNTDKQQRTKTTVQRGQQQQQQYQSAERITISGQTVQYSNGTVQIEQQQPNNKNCDNKNDVRNATGGQIASSSSLKPQQQIQLQQQIRQQNMLFRQNQQIQKTTITASPPPTIGIQLNSNEEILTKSNDYQILEQLQTKQNIKLKCPLTGQIILPTTASSQHQQQESPVSSSTTFNRLTPPTNKQQFQTISMDNNKGPAQVGAVSTSNESPRSAESPEYSMITIKRTTPPSTLPPTVQNAIGSIVGQTTVMKKVKKPNLYCNPSSQTLGRNTITSVQAGTSKSITVTTTASTSSSLTPIILDGRQSLMNKITIEPSSSSSSSNLSAANGIIHHSQKLSPNSLIPVSNLQLQSIVREPGNQLIMTSTGQIIVMPTNQQQSGNKSSTNQMIINNNTGGNLQNSNTMIVNNKNQQQSLIINPSAQHHLNSTNIQIHQQRQNSVNNNGCGNNVVIQNSHPNLIQSPNHLIQQNHHNTATTNFIMNSSGNSIHHQPTTTMILNNGNIIHQSNGQNLLTTNTAGANLLQSNANNSTTTSLITNGTKIISNQNILTSGTPTNGGGQTNVHHQIISNSGNLISPNGGNIIGQQAVVLNTLPNGGYVIQQQHHHQPTTNYATTVDGQVVQIQENGTFLQQHQQSQQQRHIIITSPDSNKRKGKKRKGSNSTSSSSPSTPTSLSPQQSPTTIIHQHHPQIQTNTQHQVVQIATPTHQYPTQQFQISPGIQGIMMNKNQTHTTTTSQQPHQQQILFQNGQIIQPVNLIGGQQLLVPAGLVMTTPDTTLLQIQNMGMGGSIIATPQGMVLRTPSPQNKNFLSPSNGGQQFIVNSNGQMSPIGQIYGTPMSLMVPQSNNGTGTTFVQQNATIVQQPQQHQTIQIQNQSPNRIVSANQLIATTNNNQKNRGTSASPPDTTTHSPRSPERPASQRSGGSDMVQCVSSSEPDSVVSPSNIDSAQSPTITDSDRNISYQTTTQVYKSSEPKMRRVQTPPHFTNQDMKPDSYESSSTISTSSTTKITNITASAATTTTSNRKNRKNTTNNNLINLNNKNNTTILAIPTTTTINSSTIIQNNGIFSIGELVWGDLELRRQCYWPGKIVNSPEGFCTPLDSTWVQWFGGRQNIELVAISSLKSLSEGLEAHHRAQKDTRKSRKLNSQLERAIQDAMTELDRMSSNPNSQLPSTGSTISSISSKTTKYHRIKPIKIAPAPPSVNNVQQSIQQSISNEVTNQSQQIIQQQQQNTSPTITNK